MASPSILSLLAQDVRAPDPHSPLALCLVLMLAFGLVLALVLLCSRLAGRLCCRYGIHAPPRLPGRHRWEARICRRCSALPTRRSS